MRVFALKYTFLYIFTFSIFIVFFFKIDFVSVPLNRVTWSHGAIEMLISIKCSALTWSSYVFLVTGCVK